MSGVMFLIIRLSYFITYPDLDVNVALCHLFLHCTLVSLFLLKLLNKVEVMPTPFALC